MLKTGSATLPTPLSIPHAILPGAQHWDPRAKAEPLPGSPQLQTQQKTRIPDTPSHPPHTPARSGSTRAEPPQMHTPRTANEWLHRHGPATPRVQLVRGASAPSMKNSKHSTCSPICPQQPPHLRSLRNRLPPLQRLHSELAEQLPEPSAAQTDRRPFTRRAFCTPGDLEEQLHQLSITAAHQQGATCTNITPSNLSS